MYIDFKEVFTFKNILKWGALAICIFFAASFAFGGDIISFGLEFTGFIAIVCLIFVIISFSIGIASGSLDSGNNAVMASINDFIKNLGNYGKGYYVFRVSLVLMTTVSGVTTWNGIRSFLVPEIGNIVIVHMLPVLMAVAFSCVVYSFWSRLFSLVASDSLSFWKKLCAVTIYPVIGGLIIFIISTVTSVMGMGGKTAVKQHYLVAITQYKDVLRDTGEYRKEEVTSISLLDRYSKKYQSSYEDEVNGTGRTGAKGEGAVANFLYDTKEEFSSLHSIMLESDEKVVQLHESINAELNKMADELMKTDMGVESIEKTMEESLEGISQQILELRNNTPLPALKSLVSYLKYSKKDFQQLSSNKATKQLQVRALQYYEGLIDKTTEELNAIITPLESRAIPEIPKITRINPSKAIFNYWEDVFNNWAIAIAIDFWVVIWLFMFLVFGRKEIMFDKQNQYDQWSVKQ